MIKSKDNPTDMVCNSVSGGKVPFFIVGKYKMTHSVRFLYGVHFTITYANQ